MRLTFEEDNLLKATTGSGDMEAIKHFLTAALAAKANGDPYNYNQVVQQMKQREDQDMVACVFVGLISCVSDLTQR